MEVRKEQLLILMTSEVNSKSGSKSKDGILLLWLGLLLIRHLPKVDLADKERMA